MVQKSWPCCDWVMRTFLYPTCTGTGTDHRLVLALVSAPTDR
jgi:hypothetical protein